MSETVLTEPLPLVWVGEYDEISADNYRPWQRGWAFFSDAGRYACPRPLRPGLDRRPIVVLCPMGDAGAVHNSTPFCIDAAATSDGGYWDVTVDVASLVVGAQPRITVHPSIHLVGIWHGWLVDGVLRQ